MLYRVIERVYMYKKNVLQNSVLLESLLLNMRGRVLNPKNRNEADKVVKNNQITIYIHSAVPTEYRSSVVAAPGVDGVDAMPL